VGIIYVEDANIIEILPIEKQWLFPEKLKLVVIALNSRGTILEILYWKAFVEYLLCVRLMMKDLGKTVHKEKIHSAWGSIDLTWEDAVLSQGQRILLEAWEMRRNVLFHDLHFTLSGISSRYWKVLTCHTDKAVWSSETPRAKRVRSRLERVASEPLDYLRQPG
jgi:hypothetical protein